MNYLADWITAISTMLIAAFTGFVTFKGFAIYKLTKQQRIVKATSAICKDIQSTLRYFKKGEKMIKELIKNKEDPFITYTNTPRLEKLLEENADILEENQIENIADLVEQLAIYETLVVDLKSRAFAQLPQERRQKVYGYMVDTLQEILKTGKKATECLNPDIPE